jgi:hypothetical protein
MLKQSIKDNPNTYAFLLLYCTAVGYLLLYKAPSALISALLLSLVFATIASLIFRSVSQSRLLITANTLSALTVSAVLILFSLEVHAMADFYLVPYYFFISRGWLVSTFGVSALISMIAATVAVHSRADDFKDWLSFGGTIFGFCTPALLLLWLLIYLTLSGSLYAASLLFISSFVLLITLLLRRASIFTEHYMRRPDMTPDVLQIELEFGLSIIRSSWVIAILRIIMLWLLWLPVLVRLAPSGRIVTVFVFTVYAAIELAVARGHAKKVMLMALHH